ncbi:MAG: IS1380 family transposase [bacterium]|nr:IS1380 family transposase [bacterium]
MGNYSKNSRKKELKIQRIETTTDRLTGRAGLALFVAYLHGIQIFGWIDRWFATIRKNRKGLGVSELFKQVLCFMVDGTSRRLTYFDQLAKDEGYAGSIETEKAHMASSHQVKRFFKAFAWTRVFLFRRLLQTLFIWRLQVTQPDVIDLGIDTMVMDNDDAKCRHGVKPTYKKKKGFQPLQMNWGRLIVDAVFRSGDKHSNHGNTVQQMIRHMVAKIRKQYRPDVPIIIRMDSGFFDQKIFKVCEKLKIGYVCGGKLYKDVKAVAIGSADETWTRYCSGRKDYWEYIEFGSKRKTWDRFRRSIYCRLINNKDQFYLPGCRPDTVIFTNIGQGQAIDVMLKNAGAADYLSANGLVACYHERGSDELANRALKDFGHEQLPFKRFNPNAAWYYTMLLGHFLLECFKEDVSAPEVSVGSYASTVRRRLIDIAGKIVSHSGEIVLKVSQACFDSLRLSELFGRCKIAPIIR